MANMPIPTLAQRLTALADTEAKHQDSYGSDPTGKAREHFLMHGAACEAYKLAARMTANAERETIDRVRQHLSELAEAREGLADYEGAAALHAAIGHFE